MNKEKFHVFDALKPDENMRLQILEASKEKQPHASVKSRLLIMATALIVVVIAFVMAMQPRNTAKQGIVFGPDSDRPKKYAETPKAPIEGEYFTWKLLNKLVVDNPLTNVYLDGEGDIYRTSRIVHDVSGMGGGSFFNDINLDSLENDVKEEVEYFAKPVLEHQEMLEFKSLIEDAIGVKFTFSEDSKGYTEDEFMNIQYPDHIGVSAKTGIRASLNMRRDGSFGLKYEPIDLVQTREDALYWIETSWLKTTVDLDQYTFLVLKDTTDTFSVQFKPDVVFYDEIKESLIVTFEFTSNMHASGIYIDFPTKAQPLMTTTGFTEDEIIQTAIENYRLNVKDYNGDPDYVSEVLGYSFRHTDAGGHDVVIPVYTVYVRNEFGDIDQVIIGADRISQRLIVEGIYTPGFNSR